nr:MAG TPA: hypothetical protein [Caudoviricetes sp.]
MSGRTNWRRMILAGLESVPNRNQSCPLPCKIRTKCYFRSTRSFEVLEVYGA